MVVNLHFLYELYNVLSESLMYLKSSTKKLRENITLWGKIKMTELVIIGGGPAGLAAAIEARKAGIKDILI